MGRRVTEVVPDRTPTSGGLWLAGVSFVALLAAAPFVPVRPAPLMRGLAFVLLCLAALLAGLALHERRRDREGSPPDSVPITARGVYAIVRHPLYLGCDLLAWGVAALALYWGTIVPAIAFTVGVAMHARAEEEFLIRRVGEPYRAYRQTVPRFGVLTGLVHFLQRRRRRTNT